MVASNRTVPSLRCEKTLLCQTMTRCTRALSRCLHKATPMPWSFSRLRLFASSIPSGVTARVYARAVGYVAGLLIAWMGHRWTALFYLRSG